MPKYTQTLTANTYSASDVSNNLKTAFDSLGWGTGKVDIAGGYRFTATEQSNSETTPLSTSNFLENYMGKNIVNPHIGLVNRYFSGSGYLAAYIPGAVSYRLKFTILSDKLADGSVVTFDNNIQSIRLCYYTINSTMQSVINATSYSIEKQTIPTSMSVGTQYTTGWSQKEVSSHIAALITLYDCQYSIRIDAVEYKVSQNKFAFQSPNLDSPTFESHTVNSSGVLMSSLSAFPIKDAKVPIIKIGKTQKTNTSDSTTSFSNMEEVLIGEWSNVLINNNEETNKYGVINSAGIKDRIIDCSFGNDLVIRAGSNTTFSGFYLNSQQGTVYNGTVWDSLNKTQSFPLATPSYPGSRVSYINGAQFSNHRNDTNSSANSSLNIGKNSNFLVFKVKNTATLSGISIEDSWAYSTMNVNRHNINYSLYYAVKTPEGRFKITERITESSKVSLVVDKTGTNRNFVYFQQPVAINPGYLVVALETDLSRKYINTLSSSLADSLNPTRYRDIEAIMCSNYSEPKVTSTTTLSGIRYIKLNSKGSYLPGTAVNSTGTTSIVEIEALNESNTNLALSKVPTLIGPSLGGTISRVTDGQKVNTYYDIAQDTSLLIDLGSSVTNLTSVKIFYGNASTELTRVQRTFVEVSNDGVNWATLYDYNFSGGILNNSQGISLPIPSGMVFSNYSSFDFDNANNNLERFINSVNVRTCTEELNNLNLRLIQINSPTPSQQNTSFAEGWYSIGKFNTLAPSSFSREVISRYRASGFSFLSCFHFGIDLQLQYAISYINKNFMVTDFPGAYNTASLQALNGNSALNSPRFVEFGGTTSTSPDNYRYTRAYSSNNLGMSFRARNLFISNGSTPGLGVSFTNPDNYEYVTVAYTYNDNTSFLLFRLTS